MGKRSRLTPLLPQGRGCVEGWGSDRGLRRSHRERRGDGARVARVRRELGRRGRGLRRSYRERRGSGAVCAALQGAGRDGRGLRRSYPKAEVALRDGEAVAAYAAPTPRRRLR